MAERSASRDLHAELRTIRNALDTDIERLSYARRELRDVAHERREALEAIRGQLQSLDPQELDEIHDQVNRLREFTFAFQRRALRIRMATTALAAIAGLLLVVSDFESNVGVAIGIALVVLSPWLVYFHDLRLMTASRSRDKLTDRAETVPPSPPSETSSKAP